MPRVRQHQRVYAALGGRMGGELHALQLTPPRPTGERTMSDANNRIDEIVKANDVVLFMKGTPCFRNAAFRAAR